MNNVFKRMTKLLCCLIISLFIMGIGGELVKADTINVYTDKSGGVQKGKVIDGSTTVVVNADGLMDFRNGIAKSGNRYYKFKTDAGDVYCLDAALQAPSNTKTTGSEYVLINDLSTLKFKTENSKTVSLSDLQYKQIAAVIAKSNQSSSIISNSYLRYYLTQAAIWHVINGEPSNAGMGSPYTVNFKKWIDDNYSGFYSGLIEAASQTTNTEPKITIETDNAGDILSDNGSGYMESGTLKLDGYDSSKYTISVDSNSNADSCIEYNGECKTTVSNVSINDEFKVKTPIDTTNSNTEYNITVNVSAESKPTENSLMVYGRVNSTTNLDFQKMGRLVTKEIDLSTKKKLHGQYEADKVKEVSIQKIDPYTNERVAGAVIDVYDSNDSYIGTYTSTAGSDTNPTVSLPEGEYYLIEQKSPEGYIKNTVKFNFSIEKEGTELVVKQNGIAVSSATITLENIPNRTRFRKVDANGNPVAGVKFIIEEATMAGTHSGRYYFCGVTDDNGYLTKFEYKGVSCEGSDFNVNTINNNTGIFTLGVDFGSSDGIYRVVEIASSDGSDVEVFNHGSETAVQTETEYYEGHHAAWGFSIQENTVLVFNKYISFEKKALIGPPPILEFTLTNAPTISISKADMGGREIPGANMVLYDTTITTEDSYGNIDNVVDAWTSTTEPHKITGIVPGRIYELQETLAPEGYVKITTSIFFSMDADGKVTVYSDKNGTTEDNRSDVTTGTNELKVTNDYTKVQIGKSDMTSGEELEGAEVKICTIDSYNDLKNECVPEKEEWSWTSGQDGKDENGNILPHQIDMLVPGTYCIVETTAPAGHVTNNSYVKQTNSACFEVKEESGIQKIDFLNEPTTVTINKLDYETKEPISGVTFQIINLETEEVVREWVTEADEVGHIESAIPIGKYKLIEIGHPENYNESMIIDDIVMNEFEFEITEDNYNIEITVYNQKLVGVPSTGISTLNLFAIGGLLVFVGYETIKIYRRKINGFFVK